MRRRPRSQLLVLGAFLLAGATALPALAVRAAADQSTRPFPGGEYFVVGCGFSHMNNDDPIVFPGKPGASHNHTFIGNRVVDSATTPASLLGGDSTCLDVGDASAYWVPTLFAGGRAVKPLVGAGYYVRRTLGPVQPFPPGLKMIAGNQNARRAQSLSVVGWACGGLGTYPRSAAVPSLRAGSRPPSARDLPELLERARRRQRRSQAPRGLRDRRDVPALAPGGAAEPGPDLPLPVDRPRPAAAGLGPLRRARRLRQRLGSGAAGSAGRGAELGATIRLRGAIAQLGERLVRNQEVGGSSPPSSISGARSESAGADSDRAKTPEAAWVGFGAR